jgi:hypothetical protein
MKITEVPEEYKIYKIIMSSRGEYYITGAQKSAILGGFGTFYEVNHSDTINKAHIVEFRMDIERTRENVQKNKDKILQKFPQLHE